MKQRRYFIYYELWQYQCCGEPFKIGDEVCWIANKDNAKYKIKNEVINTKYSYQGCAGGNLCIVGKIINIYQIRKVEKEYELNVLKNSKEMLENNKYGYDVIVELDNVVEKPSKKYYKDTNTIIILDETSKIEKDLAINLKQNDYNIVVSSKKELNEEEFKNIRSFSNLKVFNNKNMDIESIIERSKRYFRNEKIWICISNGDTKKYKGIVNYLKEYYSFGYVYNLIIESDKTELTIDKIIIKNLVKFDKYIKMSDKEKEDILKDYKEKYYIYSTDKDSIINVLTDFINKEFK